MFRLGPFSVFPDQNRLIGPDGAVHLEPKVMAVLVALSQAAGRPVTREALMATVWAGTYVGDEALTRCISELRARLDDDARRPRYIQTIPKTGYRLLVTPSEPAEPAPFRWWWLAVAALIVIAFAMAGRWISGPRPEPSVAVLPFEAMPGDGASGHFGAGLAGDILTALARVDGLRVGARHASFQIDPQASVREIGRRLGVDNLLTGTVRRDGDRVSLAVELIEAESGLRIWADRYQGDGVELAGFQDQIASGVAAALQVPVAGGVSVARISPDIDALDLYLVGRHHWHRRTPVSLERAITFFERALQIDPDCAQAYSGLADAHLLLASYGDLAPDVAIARAGSAVEAALSLDPNLAETRASLGMLWMAKGEPKRAEHAFLRALDLAPNNEMAHMWLGNALGEQGLDLMAHHHYAEAYRLRPTHPTVIHNYLASLQRQGAYTRATRVIAELKDAGVAGEMDPMLAALALDTGRIDVARGAAQRLEDRGRIREAALIRWRLGGWQGDWSIAGESLRMAVAVGSDRDVYLARLEHAALTGGAFEAVVGDRPSEAFVGSELAWRGVGQVHADHIEDARRNLAAALDTLPGYKRNYLPFHLMPVTHLVYVTRELGDRDAAERWVARGHDILHQGERRRWGSTEYLWQALFFLAVTGDVEGAAERLRQLRDLAGVSAPQVARHPMAVLLKGSSILGRIAAGGPVMRGATVIHEPGNHREV